VAKKIVWLIEPEAYFDLIALAEEHGKKPGDE